MRQAATEIEVATRGAGLVEVTGAVADWVGEQALASGLLTVFIRHTSASLIVQENADPDVQADLADFFAEIAPAERGRYRHSAEGPDDMPAHIRSALTQVQISIPVADGRPVLGTWQGLYVFEHRTGAHRRRLALHLIGA